MGKLLESTPLAGQTPPVEVRNGPRKAAAFFEIQFMAPQRLERLQVWMSQIHAVDRPATRRKLRMALARHANDLVLEYRTRHVPGIPARRVSTRMSLQYDRRGEPSRIVGLTVDVGHLAGTTWRLPGDGAGAPEGAAPSDAPMTPDQFLPALCHDLRNALGAIFAAVEVLKSGSGGGAMSRRALQIIDRQAARMALSITNLRTAMDDRQAELPLEN